MNALIRSCLLEERTGENIFTYQPPGGATYALKWTFHNVGRSTCGIVSDMNGGEGQATTVVVETVAMVKDV